MRSSGTTALSGCVVYGVLMKWTFKIPSHWKMDGWCKHMTPAVSKALTGFLLELTELAEKVGELLTMVIEQEKDR